MFFKIELIFLRQCLVIRSILPFHSRAVTPDQICKLVQKIHPKNQSGYPQQLLFYNKEVEIRCLFSCICRRIAYDFVATCILHQWIARLTPYPRNSGSILFKLWENNIIKQETLGWIQNMQSKSQNNLYMTSNELKTKWELAKRNSQFVVMATGYQ